MLDMPTLLLVAGLNQGPTPVCAVDAKDQIHTMVGKNDQSTNCTTSYTYYLAIQTSTRTDYKGTAWVLLM